LAAGRQAGSGRPHRVAHARAARARGQAFRPGRAGGCAMICRSFLARALAAGMLAALAPAAHADTRPSIEFKVSGITGPARPGQLIQAKATFKPSQPTTLKGFDFAM